MIYVIYSFLFSVFSIMNTYYCFQPRGKRVVLGRKFLVWVEDPHGNPLSQGRAEMAPQTSPLCPENLDGDGHVEPETKGTGAESCYVSLSPASSKNESKRARATGLTEASAFPSVGGGSPSMGARLRCMSGEP